MHGLLAATVFRFMTKNSSGILKNGSVVVRVVRGSREANHALLTLFSGQKGTRGLILNIWEPAR